MRFFLSFLFVASVMAGCGGDDGGGGSSGVSSSKKLSEVTAADLKALCEDHLGQLEAVATSACTLIALGDESKEACEASRDECEMMLADSDEVDCDTADPGDLSDCPVTVGEFESCLGKLTSYLNGLSCDNAGMEPAEPPACFDELTAMCPSLFE